MNKCFTLFSTPDEIHAFIIGLGNGFCPWRPTFGMPQEDFNRLRNEYHYFMAGRALGFLLLLGIITALIALLRR